MTELPAADLELEPLAAPTRDELLEAIPLHVTIWDGDEHPVDLDAEDPSRDGDRRRCIAARQAGGRCTATVPADSLLCNAHAGRLDPRSGGLALAAKRQEARQRAEEQDAVRRLGTRAVVAEVFRRKADQLDQAVSVLLDLAAAGDRQCALALIPYMNQALGMPTERVQVDAPRTAEDLQQMGTAELAEYVRSHRGNRSAAGLEHPPAPTPEP